MRHTKTEHEAALDQREDEPVNAKKVNNPPLVHGEDDTVDAET